MKATVAGEKPERKLLPPNNGTQPHCIETEVMELIEEENLYYLDAVRVVKRRYLKFFYVSRKPPFVGIKYRISSGLLDDFLFSQNF